MQRRANTTFLLRAISSKWIVRFVVFSVIAMTYYSCNSEEVLVQSTELDKWTNYRKSSSDLSANGVWSLFEDSNNNLWIGTDNALNKFDGTSFKEYTYSDGLPDDLIISMTEDNDGRLWAGSWYGLSKFEDGKWTRVPLFNGRKISALVTLQDGDMLFAVDTLGAVRRDEPSGLFYFYYTDDTCWPCNVVQAIYQEPDETVWIGTIAGAIRFEGNSGKWYTENNGLPDNDVYSFGGDSWGNMWIGTIEGDKVGQFSDNRMHKIELGNTAPQNFITAIQEDENGDVWFGTVGNGIIRYDGSLMQTQYEFGSETVLTILKDHKGVIWVGTYKEGLWSYHPSPRRK